MLSIGLNKQNWQLKRAMNRRQRKYFVTGCLKVSIQEALDKGNKRGSYAGARFGKLCPKSPALAGGFFIGGNPVVGALLNLIIVLIVAGVLYWGLTMLWPLGAPATETRIGKAVYVLIIVLLVFAVVYYGVIPLVDAIPSGFGASRRY